MKKNRASKRKKYQRGRKRYEEGEYCNNRENSYDKQKTVKMRIMLSID